MLTEFYKNFINGDVTPEIKIINLTLSELGGQLYPYMYMLDNTGRKIEAKLIEDLRNMIFDARSAYSVDTLDKMKIHTVLNAVYELLKVQINMLRVNPERKWEVGFFNAYINDVSVFTYLMNPNKKSYEGIK